MHEDPAVSDATFFTSAQEPEPHTLFVPHESPSVSREHEALDSEETHPLLPQLYVVVVLVPLSEHTEEYEQEVEESEGHVSDFGMDVVL